MLLDVLCYSYYIFTSDLLHNSVYPVNRGLFIRHVCCGLTEIPDVMGN